MKLNNMLEAQTNYTYFNITLIIMKVIKEVINKTSGH